MFSRSILAVDIGAGSIKLLYGTKGKVIKSGFIETPQDSVEDNKITNVEEIFKAINSFIEYNKLKPKFVSFAIYGQDLVIRHIEVPNMKVGNIRQTVEWEIGQNLPDAGTNYYIDYEILNKNEGKKVKTFQVIAVAVLKDKIERYIELASRLKLQIKAIDITANCTARVFKNISSSKKNTRSIGIIDIGNKNTGITILDNGKLSIEREVPFGLDKLYKEVSRMEPQHASNPNDYLVGKFNFDNTDSELDNRIRKLFDNVFSSFHKVIQFYSTGKVDKNISQIYIIGGGSNILGIKNYIENYLSSPTTVVTEPSSIGLKMKIPKDCDFKYYLSTLGLLLRED